MGSTLDSVFPEADSQPADELYGLGRRDRATWIGWRVQALALCALLGCLALFALTRGLAQQPRLDATWSVGPQDMLQLAASDEPALQAFVGRPLLGVSGHPQDMLQVTVVDGLALQRSPRWLVSDAERATFHGLQRRLQAALSTGNVRLYFGDGAVADVPVLPRGSLRLGLLYWLLAALALGLYLLAAAVFLVQPSLRNALYSVMALCQAGNLLWMATASTLELALPPLFNDLEQPARTAFDLVTAMCMAHVACLRPRRLPHARWLAGIGWLLVAALVAANAAGRLPHAWWFTQLGCGALGLLAIALLSWSYRIEPHPFAMVLRRFSVVSVATWLLLTAAVAASQRDSATADGVGTVGSMVWVVFLASLLLLAPFMARSQQLLREFSLLAGISTVATSLDLLFVAAFSFGQFTSITLALFVSLGLYAGARQWIVGQLRGSRMVTTERLFERLYRMAREVELHPERSATALTTVLREVFEPLTSTIASRSLDRARASGDGSTLLVPVPDLVRGSERDDRTLVLRFAHGGRRLFTPEDERLAHRIVEQLQRAVAFDRAVERGRSEERTRLAQDLHDDIGARLLTLMYQAQSPAQEDYLRHTLQDLKTLTRGLAAGGHRLSHAAGEWKADVQQRLALAHVTLDWHTDFDTDCDLSMVQWSTLTRVLRELISNTIAHAQAKRVAVSLLLRDDALELAVRDDGCGREPQSWAPGLGLGGVRKRVKQLGGEVRWSEAEAGGIECRVRFAHWSQTASA